MTQNDFDSLSPGDIVYHPEQPDRVWTVVGKLPDSPKTFLAVSGKYNRRYKIGENYFWAKILGASDQKRQEFAIRYRLIFIKLITPDNWNKEQVA